VIEALEALVALKETSPQKASQSKEDLQALETLKEAHNQAIRLILEEEPIQQLLAFSKVPIPD
jgi:hypothetical protein